MDTKPQNQPTTFARRRAVQASAAALLALPLSGCAIVSNLGVSGLAESIEDNAATLNEAHTRAMMGIIAVNVLRARDRWPTNYTTLSGIKSNPTLALNGSANFSPLGLGNARLPFSGSAAGVQRNEAANAEYSVNPFANNDRSQSLFRPIAPELLEGYWQAGWPRQTLMWLFVDAVKFHDSSKFVFVNGDSAADGSSPDALAMQRFLALVQSAKQGDLEFQLLLPPSQDARRCAPLDASYLRSALAAGPPVAGEKLSDVVGVVQSLTGKSLLLTPDDRKATPLAEAPTQADRFQRKLMLCDPALPRWGFVDAEGREVAEIRTRSFDDMVYFLGETLRVSSDGETGRAGGVVLFRTYTSDHAASRAGVRFALKVEHAGGAYFMAPQAPDKVRDSGEDQSGNVLGLLNQLYQLAQSDEFLRAPEARLR